MISIAVWFVFAIVGGIIANKFKLPPALGLIIIGALIGPHFLNYVQGDSSIDLMIEIGATLLLFVTGLEFEASKFTKIGAKALIAAILKIGIVFFLGYHASLQLGYGTDVAVFMGAIMSFSSTIVICKVLEQNDMIRRQEIPFLVAILVAEDILAIFTLTFIEAAKSIQGTATIIGLYGIAEHVIFSILVLAGIYVVSLLLLRPLIGWVTHNSNSDSIVFIDIILLCGYSYAAYALGISGSIGAFLAGSLIASMPNSTSFRRAIAPFSMVFSALFFLAIGTLVNPATIANNVPLIITLIIILFISRFVGVGLVTNIFANFKTEQAVFSSLAMFSIGEFSLLIARHAKSFGVSTDLMSLSSGIIFISAIVMASSVKRSQEGVMFLKNVLPSSLQTLYHRLRHLSDYLNHGFQEIALETTYSRTLKRSVLSFFALLIIIFLSIYFWGHLVTAFSNKLGQDLGSIAVGTILVICSLSLAKSIGDMFSSASHIFGSIHVDRNRGKAGQILFFLLLFFISFSIGIYSPFFIFLFRLQAYYNYISITLFVASILLLWHLVNLIEGNYSAPSFAPRPRVSHSSNKPASFKPLKDSVPPPSTTKFRWNH